MKLLLILALAASLDAANLVNSFSANTWVQVTPGGVAAYPTGYDKLFYVPALQRACMLNQWNTSGSEQNRVWLCYSMKENRWDVFGFIPTWHNGEGCSGHSVGAWEVDPSTSRLYGTGCYSGSNVPDNTKIGPYVFDPIGRVGRLIQTATTIGYNTQQASGVFDPFNHKLVLWGNAGQQITEYNPATNVMSPDVSGVTCTGGLCPTTDGLVSAALSTSDKHFYLYQGQSVYKYNPSTKVWTKLTVTGGPPPNRLAAGWAYSTADDIFLLHAGWDGASTYYSDTWAFDPVALTWTNMSPASFPIALGAFSPIFERLVYFEDQDAFMAQHITSAGGATSTWIYRYRGAGVFAGTDTRTYPASAGLNLNTTQWALNGAVTTSGTDTYIAWAETSTSQSYPRILVSKVDSGGNITRLASLTSMSGIEGALPSLSWVGSTLWACWNENIAPSDAQCKSWSSGTTWAGGTIGYRNQSGSGAAFMQRGKSAVVGVAGVPHVAYLELDRGTSPSPVYANVKKFSGGSWSFVGNPLNVASATKTAESIAIATDGINPWVAFTEYSTATVGTPISITQSNPKVHVMQWNGSTWVECGTSANVNSGTSGWAYDVSVTWMGSQPYVAFAERTVSGASTVYVRTWSNSGCSSGAWSTVGSSLNRDAASPAAGWASHPRIANDGTNLYVAWQEQGLGQSWTGGTFGSFGQTPQIYVARSTGSSWQLMGGALNIDSTNGAANEPEIAMLGTVPVVTWGELSPGNTRQVYAKKWTGVDWSGLSATSATCAISTLSLPPATVGQFYTTTLSQNGACSSSTWGGWTACQGISLNPSTGVLSGTVTGSSGVCSGTVTYGTASQSLSVSVTSSRGIFPLPFPVNR